MSSKIFLTLFLSVMLFLASCQGKTDIDDQYLNDIARTTPVPVEADNTNNNVVIVTNTPVPTLKAPDTVPVPKAPKPVAKKPAPKKAVVKKPAPKKKVVKAKPKPRPFYSPYIEDTIGTDHPIIKEVRVMIANKSYAKVAEYINKYDLDNNPPAGLDVGHLYHFKGIAYFYLSANNRSNVPVASDSFAKVSNKTDKEKFKRLAVLWNGMLYETYASSPEDLNKAIALFDELLNARGRDIYVERFLSDAAYYRACALKKLNRIDEANEEIARIRTGVYQDKDIYSHKKLDYLPVETVLQEFSSVGTL